MLYALYTADIIVQALRQILHSALKRTHVFHMQHVSGKNLRKLILCNIKYLKPQYHANLLGCVCIAADIAKFCNNENNKYQGTCINHCTA